MKMTFRLSDIPLDRSSIGQDRLNIASKVRSNLFPWKGQFSPQLVHTLLEAHSSPGSFVLDPFMGSGTVLVEASRLGLPAFGTEINPAAFMMAQAYRFINIELKERKRILDHIDDALAATSSNQPLLHKHAIVRRPSPVNSLVQLWHDENDVHAKSVFETLIVLLDFYKRIPTPDETRPKWKLLRAKLLGLPYSTAPIGMAMADARRLPPDAQAVDLVISSPPYINVFNYHQQYRASAEALSCNLLHVAQSEIGANRKHRGNRFLTVIQYCLDMAQAILEMRRVCNPSARVVLIVGRESNVRKTRFFNAEIVSNIAIRCAGLQIVNRQERVFRNKFGVDIYEDILHFERAGGRILLFDTPLTIAREFLEGAKPTVVDDSLPDLESAIESINTIKPSPVYRPNEEGPRRNHESSDTALRKTGCDASKRQAARTRQGDNRVGDRSL